MRLARRTLGIIKGNLFWAFAYNVAAIPLAMAALLNPLVAAAAMALDGTVGGARKTFSAFSRKVQYAAARPHKGALRLGLAVPPAADKRLEAAKPNEGWSDRLKSIVTLTKISEVDAGLKKLLKQAWEGA